MPSVFSPPTRAARSILSRLVPVLWLALAALAPAFAGPAAAAAGPTLDVRVVDPDGLPVPGARVVVSGAAAAPIVAHAGADGRCSLALAEGVFVVRASAPGLASGAHRVTLGSAGASLEIVLRVAAVDEALVVTAAQVDLPRSQTPDAVTVLDGADLERRQIATLGAALRAVPGFTVAQTGGPGTVTSLFPRGGESDFTLVLVDGIRANAFGGGLDLSQVPLLEVERIEVVRGPQSAVFGADAVGGVVQIVTRQGGPSAVHARLEAGSRSARHAAIAASGGRGGWRWSAAADHRRDAGFTGTAPASGERVGNDDAASGQAGGSIGWRGGRGTDVRATLRRVATDRGAPGPYGSDPAGLFAGVDRVSRGETVRWAGGVRVVHPWFGPASRVRQVIDADAAAYDLRFTSRFGRSESRTSRTHARVQTDASLSAALGASAGVEWMAERAESTFITAGAARVPIDRRVIGTFGEARWHAGDRVSVTAGLRAEHIRRAPLAGHPSPFSPRPDFAADTIVSVNPKVAAAWLVSGRTPGEGAPAWTRLRAAAGTGIRPPDAFEIAFTDNPGLRPERSRTAEAGLVQALAGGAVQLEATAFVNTYDDLIVATGRFTATSRFRTDNISNARARGVELSAAIRTGRALEVRASYTYLDTAILAVDRSREAPPPFAPGDPLLRRPRHQGTIDAGWTGTRASAFASVRLRGRTLDAEPNLGTFGGLFPNPGFHTVAAGGDVRLGRLVSVYGRAENLLDRAYEEVLGYPAPHRTLAVGVRLAARR